MIYKTKPPRQERNWRIVKRFALFPVNLGNNTSLWLESYYALEVITRIHFADYPGHDRWMNKSRHKNMFGLRPQIPFFNKVKNNRETKLRQEMSQRFWKRYGVEV